MKAVILAGGEGTRMKGLAAEVPKPLIRVGDASVLEHQVRLLARYDIRDVILIVGRLGSAIKDFFGDGERFGVRIEYFEEARPLGTTGGIKEIEAKLSSDFVVFYGDVMLDMNLRKMIEFHKTKKSCCTLALHPNDHPQDSDLVEINDDRRIVRFHPKPHPDGVHLRNLVNAAVYVFSPRVLAHIERGVKADFGRDLFPRIIEKERLYGYTTSEYIKDMGTPERLEEVTRDYLSGRIHRFNSDYARPVVFLDRDGVINEEVGLLHRIEDFRLIEGAGSALRKINGSDCLAIVVTNQPVVAKGLCSIEDVEEIHKKMDTLLGKQGAKLDGVYYCPHHPDKGYPGENPKYKIECDCRKPKTGMIERARREFSIDMPRSFLIGDSFRDILCGRAARLATIGVRTGKGCKDGRPDPDHWFENLAEAADFIVNDPLRPHFEHVQEVFSKLGKRPFVVRVGGNSRSGKTTFATYVAKRFAEAGLKTLVIRLDDWILPLDCRKDSQNVFDRFQISAMSKDVSDLFRGREIALRKYDPLSRGPGETEIRYVLKDEEIVILEGVVALASETLAEIADLSVYCEIAEGLLQRRLAAFYSWKGLDAESIRNLIDSRMRDEYPLIAEGKTRAALIIGGP